MRLRWWLCWLTGHVLVFRPNGWWLECWCRERGGTLWWRWRVWQRRLCGWGGHWHREAPCWCGECEGLKARAAGGK